MTQTTRCTFSGKSPSSGHKTTLKQTAKRLKTVRSQMRAEVTCLFFFLVVVFSACRKSVGKTMTCDGCDVMNVIWRKTKTDGERWGSGGILVSDLCPKMSYKQVTKMLWQATIWCLRSCCNKLKKNYNINRLACNTSTHSVPPRAYICMRVK